MTELLTSQTGYTKFKAANDDGVSPKAYFDMQSTYKNAVTPDGYSATEAGNAPGWAKALAVINSSYTDAEKLVILNLESGRKDDFASLGEAREYYEARKDAAKIEP